MPGSTRKAKSNKIGRPKTTGPGVAMMVRMHKPQIKALDRWIGKAELSRPEAIRQLVDWALKQSQAPHSP
jgi:hypothetical protein